MRRTHPAKPRIPRPALQIVGALVWLLTGLLVASPGCSGRTARDIEPRMQPSWYRPVSKDTITPSMQRLSYAAWELDQLMREHPEPGPEERERIRVILSEMQAASDTLGPGGWTSNHPRISANVERFREDLVRARSALDGDPPNYFWVGSVSASCRYCHPDGNP